MSKILFVTRKFPPFKGGMEKFSKNFYDNLSKNINSDLLYEKNILLLLLKFIFKNKSKYSHIHFGDGVLTSFIFFLRNSKIKKSITLHGLDIIYNNFFYQFLLKQFLLKFDKIVCVSNFSLNQALKRGVNKEKLIVITNGINNLKLNSKNSFLDEYKLKDKMILFSVGRQIKRKGINWFLENVFSHLSNEFVYFIAGLGPELKNIKKTIKKYSLEERVFVLGRISDEKLNYFYKNSNFFMMPNIKIPDDMEGFGITLIESSYFGCIPIATNIEGIKDAIIDNFNGHLIEEKNIQDFISIFDLYLKNKNLIEKNSAKFAKNTKSKFSWDIIIKKYIDEVFN